MNVDGGGLALVRLRPAKGFYRYEFNFRTNSPLPACSGRGSGAGGPSRRSRQPALERYVPMQTCCLHRVLRARGNDEPGSARSSAVPVPVPVLVLVLVLVLVFVFVLVPCPGWLPVIQ